MTEDQLMSVKELAEYLRVNISTVYLWSQRGQIPAMKMGKMWRFRRSEIDQWLRGRRSPPLEPEQNPRSES